MRGVSFLCIFLFVALASFECLEEPSNLYEDLTIISCNPSDLSPPPSPPSLSLVLTVMERQEPQTMLKEGLLNLLPQIPSSLSLEVFIVLPDWTVYDYKENHRQTNWQTEEQIKQEQRSISTRLSTSLSSLSLSFPLTLLDPTTPLPPLPSSSSSSGDSLPFSFSELTPPPPPPPPPANEEEKEGEGEEKGEEEEGEEEVKTNTMKALESMMTGEYVLFITDFTRPSFEDIDSVVQFFEERKQPNTNTNMTNTELFEAWGGVGVAGGVMVNETGWVMSGGVELNMMQNPVNDLYRAYRDVRSMWSLKIENTYADGLLAAPTHRYIGAHKSYGKVNKMVNITCVSSNFFFVPRDVYLRNDGFHDKPYFPDYHNLDFCLRLKSWWDPLVSEEEEKEVVSEKEEKEEIKTEEEEREWGVVVLPIHVVAKLDQAFTIAYHRTYVDSITCHSSDYWSPVKWEKFYGIYEKKMNSLLQKQKEDVFVNWEFNCQGSKADLHEALGYLLPLEQKIKLSVTSDNFEWCKRNGGMERAFLYERCAMSRLTGIDSNDNKENWNISIIQKTPNNFNEPRERAGVIPMRVGRTMYTTDKIPKDWISEIKRSRVNSLWVPSTFNLYTFWKSGINPNRLSLFPSVIDTDFFAPLSSLLTPPSSPPFRSFFHDFLEDSLTKEKGWGEGEEKVEEEIREGEGESGVVGGREVFYFSSPGSCASPSEEPFVFFSIFNVDDHRKGWRQLLSAYYSEFSRDEPVMLVVLARNFHLEHAVKSFIDDYTTYHIGRDGEPLLSDDAPRYLSLDEIDELNKKEEEEEKQLQQQEERRKKSIALRASKDAKIQEAATPNIDIENTKENTKGNKENTEKNIEENVVNGGFAPDILTETIEDDTPHSVISETEGIKVPGEEVVEGVVEEEEGEGEGEGGDGWKEGWNMREEMLKKQKEEEDREREEAAREEYRKEKRKGQEEKRKKEWEEGKERRKGRLSRVFVIGDEVMGSEVVSLYRSVDAFVLPTRGEGWGRTLAEAMAMELPVIATNWSGNMDFMTQNNSYPVPVESFRRVSPEDDHQWALPSVYELRKQMREVYCEREKARMVGKKAREDIVGQFSQEVTIPLFMDHIHDLIKKQKQMQEEQDKAREEEQEKMKNEDNEEKEQEEKEQEEKEETQEEQPSPCYNKKVRVMQDNIAPHFSFRAAGEFPK